MTARGGPHTYRVMVRVDAIRMEDDAFPLASPRACVASCIVGCSAYMHMHELLSIVIADA